LQAMAADALPDCLWPRRAQAIAQTEVSWHCSPQVPSANCDYATRQIPMKSSAIRLARSARLHW